METFITELSSVIKNWPAASVSRTTPAPLASAFFAISTVATAKRARTPDYGRAPGRDRASPTSEEPCASEPVVVRDRRVGGFDETGEDRRRSVPAPDHRHGELAACVRDRNCRKVAADRSRQRDDREPACLHRL